MNLRLPIIALALPSGIELLILAVVVFAVTMVFSTRFAPGRWCAKMGCDLPVLLLAISMLVFAVCLGSLVEWIFRD